MTRADAIQQILAIIDVAEPPIDPIASAPGAAAAPVRAQKSQPSQTGDMARNSSAEKAGEKPRPAPGMDAAAMDALAEERRREEEIRRAALNAELAHLPQTDLGNVERFRKRFGHMFKWSAALGWFYWDGRRWARKGADERVKIAGHETARAIQDEAKAVFDQAQAIADKFDADELEEAERQTKKKKKASKDEKPKRGRRKKAAEDDDEDDPPELTRKQLEQFLKFKRLRMTGLTLQDWGLQSEMNSKLTPIDKHAAPYLAVDVDRFDADPWMINVANGTLVVDKTAAGFIRFKPHDPEDLITKISPVDFEPRAECVEFDKFIARVQPDLEQRRMLFAWMGYSLTGDTTEQKLMMLHGEGRNGKGVFVRACAYVAGDYAKATPIETFLAETAMRNASQPTPHLAALPSVRLLFTNEPKKGSVLDEAFIKLVTGGDMISARELNKPQFEFLPAFKLTISGNHKPKIHDQTESIWARMQLVPWDVIIPAEERDLKLDDKLKLEASGILNVLLDGLRDWLANGIVMSKAAAKATAKYREDSDPLGRYLADCTAADPEGRVQSSAAYELFLAWAKATGAAEWKHAGFTNAMKERGIETVKSSVMFYVGIRLTKKVDDFADHLGRTFGSESGDRAPAHPRAMAREDDDDPIPF